jgi:hypothetical protein
VSKEDDERYRKDLPPAPPVPYPHSSLNNAYMSSLNNSYLTHAINELDIAVKERDEWKKKAEELEREANHLHAEMVAVEKYLKPNWSNDMEWSDEIIIAIDQRVADAEPILEESMQRMSTARWSAEEKLDAVSSMVGEIAAFLKAAKEKA